MQMLMQLYTKEIVSFGRKLIMLEWIHKLLSLSNNKEL